MDISIKKKYVYLIAFCVFVTVAVVVLFFKEEKKNAIVEVKASVEFADKKFVISNIDTFDFVHADLIIDDYFKLRNINLKAGETYTIWQAEFLHHNGTHFPNTRRPLRFSIWCELYDGRNGFFSKKLN